MIVHRGSNEVVGYGYLFVLDIENALIGLRPHPVKVFDCLLSFELGVHALRLEMIAGVRDHHVRCKDFLVAAGDLQIAVPGVCLKEEPMPRVFSDREQPVNCNIQLGHIVFSHRKLPCVVAQSEVRRRNAIRAGSGADSFGGRNGPGAIENRRVALVGPIHPQHQDKFACGCGQPVALLVGPRRVLLDQYVD